ncbi:phosphotransferase [Ruthenibacterium lactatiformans]|jgi:aminoglycoside phosphotransferase|uniref:phosphotransferase n=2 Tax=Ruthenibacterium TaxID=1905344 RepID=UPI00242C10B1|nr:phosphotransferase [Ruthenibacterium lactatiformans]
MRQKKSGSSGAPGNGGWRDRVHNQTERTEAYEKNLKSFLCEEYGFRGIAITPAKRGFYGETWRLDTPGKSYFVKLVYFADHQYIYTCSFGVMDFLRSKGIDFISAIVKTTEGALFTRFDGAVLGVFNWIDGENIETDETKIREYQMLAKIYTVPSDGVHIRREDFSGKSADMFFKQWALSKDSEILLLLEKNRAKLEYRSHRLQHFAALCRKDTSHFYITHGDAGGNFFVSGDKAFLLDWDDVLLAPPERDAWVMGFRDWARCLFQRSLREQGIEYSLKPERLAYYSYYMFFFWLAWLVRCSDAKEIESFLAEYGEKRIEYADDLWKKSLDGPADA